MEAQNAESSILEISTPLPRIGGRLRPIAVPLALRLPKQMAAGSENPRGPSKAQTPRGLATPVALNYRRRRRIRRRPPEGRRALQRRQCAYSRIRSRGASGSSFSSWADSSYPRGRSSVKEIVSAITSSSLYLCVEAPWSSCLLPERLGRHPRGARTPCARSPRSKSPSPMRYQTKTYVVRVRRYRIRRSMAR